MLSNLRQIVLHPVSILMVDNVKEFLELITDLCNSAGWWTYFSNDVKVDAGKTMKVNFINYAGGANWNNWLVILRQASGTEYGVFRADNWAWRYDINPVPGTVYSGG